MYWQYGMTIGYRHGQCSRIQPTSDVRTILSRQCHFRGRALDSVSPRGEKEKHVHQHLTVEFRLLLCGGKGSKGCKDQAGVAFRAVEDRYIEDGDSRQDRQNEVSSPPMLCSDMCG